MTESSRQSIGGERRASDDAMIGRLRRETVPGVEIGIVPARRVDPNYRERMPVDDILAALEAIRRSVA